VIDTEAGQRITSIKGLKKPTGVRVTPARHVVAASGDDGKVRVFDANLKLLGTIDGLDDADKVRLDPAGKIAYAGYGDGALAAIDVDQIRKTDNVKLAGHPGSISARAEWSSRLRECADRPSHRRRRSREAEGDRKVAREGSGGELPDGAGRGEPSAVRGLP
jgi:hypothetical protein